MGSIDKETVDEIVKRIDTNVKEVKDKQIIQNGRVKKLELWRSFLAGAWAVVSLILIIIVIPLSIDYFKEKQITVDDVIAQLEQKWDMEIIE